MPTPPKLLKLAAHLLLHVHKAHLMPTALPGRKAAEIC
jgi:hypothetical protein